VGGRAGRWAAAQPGGGEGEKKGVHVISGVATEAARALLEPIAPRIAALPPDARQRFAISLHCLAEVCGAG